MTNKKIETGTGGFEVDGKVVTYDVGVEREELDDGNWDGGDINVDKQKRDLSKITKLTLANYLHKTTLGKTKSVPQQAAETGNRYSVERPEEFGLSMQEFSTTTPEGLPIGPSRVPNSAFEPTIGPLGESAQNGAVNNLPRPKWFTEQNVIKGMNRQKLPAVIDGNDLLRTAVVNEQAKLKEGHPVKTYSSALIKNRWTSDASYDSAFLTEEPNLRELDRPIGALKYPLGKSYTPEYYETKQESKNLFGIGERLLSARQLANVGPVLMARASGEVFFSNSDFDPQNLGVQIAAATIPSPVQLGVSRVEEIKLRALDVMKSLKIDADGIGDGSVSNITPGSAFSSLRVLNSWGTLNNQYDKFSGGALGMQILAIALILAVTLIPALLLENAVFGGEDAGRGANSDYTTMDVFGRYKVGRYRGGYNLGGSINIAALLAGQVGWKQVLGFPNTEYPLDRCMAIGTLVFFNITVNDQGLQPGFYGGGFELGKAIGEAVSQQNPEAYVIFARAIARSFLQVAEKLLELVASIVSPAAFASQLLGFINFFRSAQIMQTLNMFAQLGDKILTIPPNIEDRAASGVGKKMSQIDMDTIDQEASVKKSRLISMKDTRGTLRLAWSSFRAKDLLAYPKYLDVIPHETDANGGAIGKPRIMPSVHLNDDKGISPAYDGLKGGIYYELDQADDRIPTEVRQRFEDVLGGEYMPFYFHDVRTNELVSFHAFLLSLNDSYSAAYDSIDAIGRVESIKTYRSTSRKIDLSFQVAALSEEDFDYMWLKINKLASMVYPQFSPGRFAEDDQFKITIPFSQQVAAAPMIRLRIGDLIQSNYSRFNLARLFGYGYEDHAITTDESSNQKRNLKSDKEVQDSQAKFNTALQALADLEKKAETKYNDLLRVATFDQQIETYKSDSRTNYPPQTPPPTAQPTAPNGAAAAPPPKAKPKSPEAQPRLVPGVDSPVYTYDPNKPVIVNTNDKSLVSKGNQGSTNLVTRIHPDLALVPIKFLPIKFGSRIVEAAVECLVVPNYEKLNLAYDLKYNDLKPTRNGKTDAKQAVEIQKLQKLINDFTPVQKGLTNDPAAINNVNIEAGSPIDNRLKILGLTVIIDDYTALQPTAKTSTMIVAAAEKQARGALLTTAESQQVESKKKEIEDLKSTLAKYTAANKDFMDPSNNAIVRSFESSGGRGLPGFIESLSFDWFTSTTWEIDAGRGKAPKMCRVTVSFSPFHDITPGLDHKGANRAPIYNVGPHRKYYK